MLKRRPERETDIERLLAFAILCFLILITLSLMGCTLPLYATNPCLASTYKWQAEQAKLGNEIGMAIYNPNGREDVHAVGYIWGEDGERKFYDCGQHKWITLNKWDRSKGILFIPHNFRKEETDEGK